MFDAVHADQFRQSFRDEAREILVDLEAALLELNEDRGDLQLVGRVFRALHTIKGSGAMFGFEELAGFSHNLENAFDEVRNGRLAVSAELVDLTLAALDQIRGMLEEGAAGAPGADAAACAEILAQVRRLTGKPESVEAEQKEAAPAVSAAAVTRPGATGTGGRMREWHIRFAPGPEMMQCGANPLLLLRELRQLGSLSVQASTADVPPLEELDPERCYVRWEMVLATAAGADAIRDVFIFVEDSCELSMEVASEPDAELASSAAPGCAADESAKGLEEQRIERRGRRSYDAPDNATSLRVPAAKLDQFVDLIGEMVTVQARVSEIASRSDDPEFAAVAEEIERLTSALRESSMTIRMLPIRATFEKFRRLVHDLARDLGKDVELTMEGADTELDKTVIDQLSDPLMHLIRNSMDHGIETQPVRAARGKRPTAHIHLSARHSGATVLVGVADDGNGIDAEAVRRRAMEKGLVEEDAALSDAEIFALIFQPGFSTAERVTDVSGRGVGMDVVRQRVESLRGTIDVASQRGAGTSVTLRLPLTMAIIDGLLVGVGEERFVLPLANTLECVELSANDVERAGGKHLAEVRGELIPYIRLRQHFHIRGARPAIEQIMVVETEQGRYGFAVDEVLGNCQTVIKNLGRFYRHVQVVSGATILGNGTVALILDPQRLVQDAESAGEQGARRQKLLSSTRASSTQTWSTRTSSATAEKAGACFITNSSARSSVPPV
ncbi:MAG: chemotaxis protein CheA [Acidobacteriaceae bacterium]